MKNKQQSTATETVSTAKRNKFLAFLARKDIVFSGKRYGIDALGAMALGLFGSLLIATIFNAIGLIPFLSFFKTIGGYGAKAAGPAMAVAIAFALKAPPPCNVLLCPGGLYRQRYGQGGRTAGGSAHCHCCGGVR